MEATHISKLYTMAAPAELASTTIDTLLERYLTLLDEYTTLRNSLNGLQSGIYQNIARANFSAERGIRYGQDHYDDRMQAARRVHVKRDGHDGGDGTDYVFSPGHGYALNVMMMETGGAKSEGEEGEERGSPVQEESEQQEKDDEPQQNGSQPNQGKEEENEEKEETNTPTNKILISKTDPLRWFGLLTPPALRQAQTQAIQAVDDIIPKLATVNMAMAEVELVIRRARKKRAKAEAAAEREKMRQGQGRDRDRESKQEEQVYRDLERLALSSSAGAAAVDA